MRQTCKKKIIQITSHQSPPHLTFADEALTEIFFVTNIHLLLVQSVTGNLQRMAPGAPGTRSVCPGVHALACCVVVSFTGDMPLLLQGKSCEARSWYSPVYPRTQPSVCWGGWAEGQPRSGLDSQLRKWTVWDETHAPPLTHCLTHFCKDLVYRNRASQVVQLVKNSPAMWEIWVWSLGWEDPLEKEVATHFSILAWRIPWTIKSMGSQRVGHDWATFIERGIHGTHLIGRIK